MDSNEKKNHDKKLYWRDSLGAKVLLFIKMMETHF